MGESRPSPGFCNAFLFEEFPGAPTNVARTPKAEHAFVGIPATLFRYQNTLTERSAKRRIEANPLAANHMAVEQPERDPREIENVLMPIKEAFEQSIEAGVAAAKNELRKLTRGEDTDPELAAVVAEKLDLTPYDIPDELQNQWETTLGEALMYGGKVENGYLDKAQEHYRTVVKRTQHAVEGDPDLSHRLHSLDRMGDTSFLSGDYVNARLNFLAVNTLRDDLGLLERENGPAACALYGESASLLMQGQVGEALECIEQARKLLKDKKDEDELTRNINNLETAAMALDELDLSLRNERLAAMKDLLQQNGGKDGGVKHIDFNNLYTEAERAAENLEI